MAMYKASPFRQFARRASKSAGHPIAFLAAVVLIVVWAGCGPIFGFSDTWQLVVNTATTVFTFLMVFLIQNSQNHDAAAVQIKLNELIRVTKSAHNVLLNLETLSDAELDRQLARYARLADAAREHLRRTGDDFGTPKVDVD
jgi:low affinity Fe/Cu permease